MKKGELNLEETQDLYRGVVENNEDPEKRGRVQVRIQGVHSGEKTGEEEVTVEHLPWAEIMGTSSFGLVSGIGLTSVLRNGTWVYVKLEQDDPDKPIILGVVTGTPTEKSDGGFNDPNKKFPFDERIGEPDTNELARGEIKNTVIHELKNNKLMTDAKADEVAQEPSKYPYNAVLETESGHVLEFDDTPGAERVQLIDRQGNYIEMKIKQMIDKAVNDKISYIMENRFIHVGGNLFEYVQGFDDKTVEQNQTNTILRNIIEKVGGSIRVTAAGNLEFNCDILVNGKVETTGDVFSSSGEIFDKYGSLDMLRQTYNQHFHIGNLGIPTSQAIISDPGLPGTPVTVTDN